MKFHKIADLFPLIEKGEFKLLCEDIKQQGLNHSVILLDGKILDGRNRYRACIEVGIEPRYEKFKGSDPLAFVLSENLHRRHLTISQRTALAAEVANMQSCYRADLEPTAKLREVISSEEASNLFQVGKRYVEEAKAIKKRYPGKFAELKSGKKTIQQSKREIIQENVKEQPELPDGKYRVIYADPPWSYGNDYTRAMKGSTRPEDHYPTMKLEEIGALKVPDLAGDNSVLFLWTTSPLLEDSFRVVRMWGFNYKTSFIWNKIKHNFGYYNSVRHEILLICTKGSCRPDNPTLFKSVQSIERTAHSSKPEKFREIIDTLYTTGKKIELFSRAKTEGWDTWGNQV